VADPEGGQIRPWPPSSLAIGFGPLQRRNKHEILGHIKLAPPPITECLDLPLITRIHYSRMKCPPADPLAHGMYVFCVVAQLKYPSTLKILLEVSQAEWILTRNLVT